MNVVLYTRDMEPITIIDLPLWALKHGERLGFVQIEHIDSVTMNRLEKGDPVIQGMVARRITLEFIPIRLQDKRSWLVMVDDEALALELLPGWLPGQRKSINAYERSISSLAKALLETLARGAGGH